MVLKMKRCNECMVDVNEVSNVCPLCSAKLEKINDDKEYYTYPKLEVGLKKYRKTYKLLFLLLIFVCLVSLIINTLTFSGVKWSLMLVAGLAYWTIGVAIALNYKTSKTYKLILQAVALSIMAIIIDCINGYSGISVNYAIPIITGIINLIAFSIIVLNKTKWTRYVMYQLTILIMGLVPLVFIPFNLIYTYLPLLISVSISMSLFILTALFKNKELKNEYIRRFYI